MKSSKRTTLLPLMLGGLGLGVFASPAIAQDPSAAKPSTSANDAPPQSATPSEASALVDELRRSVDELAIEEAPRPYEATAHLLRAQALTLDGSYGGIITDLVERQAFARLDLRVGTAAHDASNFFGGGMPATFNLPLVPLAAGDSGRAAARALWRVADAAYRDGVSTFRAKEAAMRQLAEISEAADRAPAPGVAVNLPWSEDGQLADAPLRSDLGTRVDHAGLRAAVAELSAQFASHPAIDNGDVFLQIVEHDRTSLDARGAAWGETKVRAYLAVVADSRADDGMHLDHGAVLHLQSIPDPAWVRAQGRPMVERVLEELTAMREAPMVDEDYDGPVLFEARAAAQLWASTAAVHVTGAPAPLSEWGRVVELEPHWLERLGRPVLPPWLGLVDDPRAKGFGHYERDAEGVEAQRIDLVKRGVLSDLLMTRRPNDKIDQSNGHARMAFDLAPAAAISNLEVKSSRRGLSSKRLEAELLRRAREDGYDYAYVVETLRDGGVLGSPPRDTATMFGGGRKVTMPLPGRLFRIEANGKRTLVRGAVFSPVAMRALRRVREVGNQASTVAMRIAPGIIGGWAVDLGADGLLTQTVDVQVTTPALLIDGFELVVERGENERLPFLVHPLRRESDEASDPTVDDASEQPAPP